MNKLYPWEKEEKDGFVQEEIRVDVPLLPIKKNDDDKRKDAHPRGIVVIDLYQDGN